MNILQQCGMQELIGQAKWPTAYYIPRKGCCR